MNRARRIMHPEIDNFEPVLNQFAKGFEFGHFHLVALMDFPSIVVVVITSESTVVGLTLSRDYNRCHC